MKITINGNEHKLTDQISLTELLEDFALDPAKVAIERNMEIVPSSHFESTFVENEDKIEIVYFIGGG